MTLFTTKARTLLPQAVSLVRTGIDHHSPAFGTQLATASAGIHTKMPTKTTSENPLRPFKTMEASMAEAAGWLGRQTDPKVKEQQPSSLEVAKKGPFAEMDKVYSAKP